MRDGFLKFGVATLSTKDTDVNCADVVDFGAIDADSRLAVHLTGNQENLVVVAVADAALAAGDYWIPFLEDSADNSSFTKIAQGPPVAAASAAGTRAVFPFPIKHRRYVRAGFTPKSSGTFTEKTASIFIEPGANHD